MIKFIIPVRCSENASPIYELIKSLNRYHPEDEIIIVDSGSIDKSYMRGIYHPNLKIFDVNNKNWMCGAWWTAVKLTEPTQNYAFLHDSMLFKDNINYFFENDVTFLMNFERKTNETFGFWSKKLCELNNFPYNNEGLGCWGPILFVKHHVVEKFKQIQLDKFLPTTKAETGFCEGLYGTAAEILGYDIEKITLYGDVLFEESSLGRSGLAPHNSQWMFPVEKFYSSHIDASRK
jgi:hypothetical protein